MVGFGRILEPSTARQPTRQTRIGFPATRESSFMGKFAGGKGTSWVKLRGARAPHHECVEHNQNKNERDLLRSMFGDRTRKDKQKRDVLRFAFGRRTRLE